MSCCFNPGPNLGAEFEDRLIVRVSFGCDRTRDDRINAGTAQRYRMLRNLFCILVAGVATQLIFSADAINR